MVSQRILKVITRKLCIGSAATSSWRATHHGKNRLCVDAVAKVVRMIPSVPGQIVRVFPRQQVGPQRGDIRERYPLATHLSEDVAVLREARMYHPIAFGRWQHRRHQDEFRVSHVGSHRRDKPRNVASVFISLGIGGVVHAEGDDDEIGVDGGDSLGV